MTNILIIRVISALSLITLFIYYKNEQNILDSLNQTLLIIAFLDFGLQQSAIMKYLNNKKALLVEFLIISLILNLLHIFNIISLLTLEIVFIAYICNIIQAAMYRCGKIKHVFFVIIARLFGILIVLESHYSWLVICVYIVILIICLSNYLKNEKLPSFFSKRFDLGIIATVAVLNEQIIRLEGGLSYKQSIVILSIGYLISIVSILQQSFLQYVFSEKKNEDVLSFISFQKYLYMLFLCVISIVSFMYFFGIKDVEFYLMICLMVMGNITMRYSLLLDNIAEKNLKNYIYLNFTVLLLSSFMIYNEFSNINIQIYVSLIILIFTASKLSWNTFR